MPIRPAAIVIGALLVPLNCFWLSQMEMATQYSAGAGGGPYPTTFSLFANVLVLLLVLRAASGLLGRLRPSWALRPPELLCVYVMLCIASAVDAIDFIDVLVPMVAHVHRYDDPASGRDYSRDIIPYIPSTFTVTDHDALKAWHESAPERFWRLSTLRAWLPPLALWGGVIFVMLLAMLCLAALLRTKWIDEERLSYPITYIPVQIARGGGGLFSDRTFWLGFSIAVGISLLNGLAVIYPAVPTVRVKLWDLSPRFIGRPWNAIGWTPISFYPFGIGLGYLLPPDLLFSTWFFFWLLKAERIVASAVGWMGYDAQAPYVDQQCLGAYLYVAAFGLWLGRAYFSRCVAGVGGGRRQTAGSRAGKPDLRRPTATEDGERQTAGVPEPEPIAPKTALLGGVGAILALIVLFIAFGMSPWLAVIAWAMYWLIALSVTRMRAELGPPAHDLHRGGPDHMLPIMLGTRAFGPRNLNLLTWMYFFNRAYRSLAMPHMLEGFSMARRNGFSDRPVIWAIVLGGAIGTVSTLVVLVYLGYANGAEAKMAGHATGFGWEAFNRLRGWLGNPTGPSLPSAGGALAGMAMAAVLHRLTIGHIWWPLHPLGFAIAGSYSMATMWCPMLVAWVAKTALLHYGGQRAYTRMAPLFVGLLVGDYVLGCLWPIVGWVTGRTMYSFQQ